MDVVLRAYSVRGEPRIQRIASREDATAQKSYPVTHNNFQDLSVLQ